MTDAHIARLMTISKQMERRVRKIHDRLYATIMKYNVRTVLLELDVKSFTPGYLSIVG